MEEDDPVISEVTSGPLCPHIGAGLHSWIDEGACIVAVANFSLSPAFLVFLYQVDLYLAKGLASQLYVVSDDRFTPMAERPQIQSWGLCPSVQPSPLFSLAAATSPEASK